MAIQPVTFRIVIKPFNIDEKDEAYMAAKRMGLDLSLEKTKIREQQAVDRGTVVSFGPAVFEAYNTPNPLAVGDEIVYAKHAGKEVEDIYTKEKFVLINDEDVVAIFRNEA